MDDNRLKELGGGIYFHELLEPIRDIRASEKVFYRQVLEIYATSIDYDPRAEISVEFFKKVQNKIHYAVSGETNQLILIPVEDELYFDVIKNQGPVTEEQQARMVYIDLE